MISVVLGCLRKNPKLADCSQMSLFSAIAQASTLGLETDGVLGQAYLVPYRDECVLIPGYKGLLGLARKSGEISTVTLEIVRKGDTCSYGLGDSPFINHHPNDDDPDRHAKPATHVYLVVTLKDGGKQRSVWSKNEVDAHMRKYSPSHSKSDSPWRTNWEAMAKKTVIRDMIARGLLPMSVEGQRLAANDEFVERSNIVEGSVISEQGGSVMEQATKMLTESMGQEGPEEVEPTKTHESNGEKGPSTDLDKILGQVPSVAVLWEAMRTKRKSDTLRAYYDSIKEDPDLDSEEKQAIYDLHQIREAQITAGGGKQASLLQ